MLRESEFYCSGVLKRIIRYGTAHDSQSNRFMNTKSINFSSFLCSVLHNLEFAAARVASMLTETNEETDMDTCI